MAFNKIEYKNHCIHAKPLWQATLSMKADFLIKKLKRKEIGRGDIQQEIKNISESEQREFFRSELNRYMEIVR